MKIRAIGETAVTRGVRRQSGIGAGALVLLATACGADGNTAEPLGAVQEELESCAWVTADQVFQNKIDPAFVTPSTYNTCQRGYVVDIRELSPEYTGDGSATSAFISVYVDGIDTQARCEQTQLKTILFRETWSNATSTGGEGYYLWNSISARDLLGTWSLGKCSLGLQFSSGLTAGDSYRIAVSALRRRLISSSVTIKTNKPTDE